MSDYVTDNSAILARHNAKNKLTDVLLGFRRVMSYLFPSVIPDHWAGKELAEVLIPLIFRIAVIMPLWAASIALPGMAISYLGGLVFGEGFYIPYVVGDFDPLTTLSVADWFMAFQSWMLSDLGFFGFYESIMMSPYLAWESGAARRVLELAGFVVVYGIIRALLGRMKILVG